jgi:hypothetical protein
MSHNEDKNNLEESLKKICKNNLEESSKKICKNNLEIWLNFLQSIIIVGMVLYCIFKLTEISHNIKQQDTNKVEINSTKDKK